jgi:hypothetical protein
LARKPRAGQANNKASSCAAPWAHQRPQGRSKAACTSPPPQKSTKLHFPGRKCGNHTARPHHMMRHRPTRSFWATVCIFRGSAETSSPGKAHSQGQKARKNFGGPRSPVRQRECAVVNAGMHDMTSMGIKQHRGRVRARPAFLWRERSSARPFPGANVKHFGAPRTSGGGP